MPRALGSCLSFLACMSAAAGCFESHADLDPQGTPSADEPVPQGAAGSGSGTGYGYSYGYEPEPAPAPVAGPPPAPAEAEDDRAPPEVEAPPEVAAQPAVEATADCPHLGKLVARDGTIAFQPDGGAVIAVTLENTSDDDFLHYPGLHVRWWLEDTYQPVRDDGDLLLYGLEPHRHWEHTIAVAAGDLRYLPGHEIVVQAEPFAYGATGVGEGCPPGDVLEFRAAIPQR